MTMKRRMMSLVLAAAVSAALLPTAFAASQDSLTAPGQQGNTASAQDAANEAGSLQMLKWLLTPVPTRSEVGSTQKLPRIECRPVPAMEVIRRFQSFVTFNRNNFNPASWGYIDEWKNLWIQNPGEEDPDALR